MEEKRGLSGAAFKRIAAASMLIDHIGLVLVWQGWVVCSGRSTASMTLYAVLRSIGRLAFPIFCFLLVEGFVHTRSRVKYLLRLLLFAFVSELPFDLAVHGAAWAWKGQNVMFTLALGLLAVWACEKLLREKGAPAAPRALLAVAASGFCVLAAWLLKTDYGLYGVLLILVLYLLRERTLPRELGGALVLGSMVVFGHSWWIEIFAIAALPALRLYNGERGRQSKWFFYVFYPTHFLLLVLLRKLIWGG